MKFFYAVFCLVAMLSLHTVTALPFRAPTPCQRDCFQEFWNGCRRCGGPIDPAEKTAEQIDNYLACKKPFLEIYSKCMEACPVQEKEGLGDDF